MSTRIFLSPPWMGGGEQERVSEAFASNYVAPTGPMVDRFEALFSERVGIPNVCALSSGTAGLDLLFRELGVGRGDTVICSDLTFVASIAPAVQAGAEPVFIDCEAATWTMDAQLLAEALEDATRTGRRPKAVVAVDLYGQCCDYDTLEALCATEPIMMPPRRWSRYGDRPPVMRGGWRLISTQQSPPLVAALSGPASGGRYRKGASGRSSAPGDALVQHIELGYNTVGNICAVGWATGVWIHSGAQARIAAFYQERLQELTAITWMPQAPYGEGNHWLSILQLDPRQTGVTPEQLRLALEAENIESRPVWKPMHMQPVFAGAKCYGGGVSERLFRQGLCLPSGAGLTGNDLERIAAVIQAQLG